jgi:hypothetical protein
LADKLIFILAEIDSNSEFQCSLEIYRAFRQNRKGNIPDGEGDDSRSKEGNKKNKYHRSLESLRHFWGRKSRNGLFFSGNSGKEFDIKRLMEEKVKDIVWISHRLQSCCA